jgi:hypothetical protein
VSAGDRVAEYYRQLSTDPDARAELVADPKAALAAHFGSVVDGDYRIEVIEQRPDTVTVMLPSPPRPGVDPTTRLVEVAGRVFDLLHSSGIGGYLVPDASLTWVLRDMRACWGEDRADGSVDGDCGPDDQKGLTK